MKSLGVIGGISWIAIWTASAIAAEPSFDDAFWRHWGDGRAEIATYDLEYSRYGELRNGSAVAIFVTETFSDEARVKADPGRHAKDDEFPVLKLNLVQDFPTGIYDYNLMTSAFVSLTPRWGHGAGSPAKVSFSSQEWCGHVYQQLIPDANGVRHMLHSYFDGEADRDARLDYPAQSTFEDTLLLWARGFSTPFLDAGETREADLLRSLETARLRHVPVEWERATFSRSANETSLSVPAGEFSVETLRVAIEGGVTWTFFVETEAPHRLIQWETSEGRKARLVKSDRLKYWEMNDNLSSSSLEKIGLSPRPERTP